MKKRSKLVVLVAALVVLAAVVTGCGWAGFGSSLNDLTGMIKGNTYECQFYSNSGELFMTAEGQNIKLTPNIVDEYTYSGERWEITETISSVLTITIDGKQMESCGSTILFVEKGLKPDVEFDTTDIHISSDADGLGDLAFIAETVNKYKNYFGKGTVHQYPCTEC